MQPFLDVPECISTLLQVGLLYINQSVTTSKILSRGRKDTEENTILIPWFHRFLGGNGMHPPKIQRGQWPRTYNLSVRSFIGPVNHLLVNLFPLFLVCISAQFWLQILQGDASNTKPLHIGTLESSSFPRTHPWQLSEWTPSLSPIRKQNWAESRLQPFSITQILGKPVTNYVGLDISWVWNNKKFAVWNVHHTVGNDELKDVHVPWTKPSWLSLADRNPAVTIQTGVCSHFARDNFWCSKEKAAML